MPNFRNALVLDQLWDLNNAMRIHNIVTVQLASMVPLTQLTAAMADLGPVRVRELERLDRFQF